MSASTPYRGSDGSLSKFSAAGFLLAMALAAALATAVGVAAWTLRSSQAPPADEVARLQSVAYAHGRAVGYAAGRLHGRKVGYALGHRRGYRAGFRAGVHRGERLGGALGRTDGYREG